MTNGEVINGGRGGWLGFEDGDVTDGGDFIAGNLVSMVGCVTVVMFGSSG